MTNCFCLSAFLFAFACLRLTQASPPQPAVSPTLLQTIIEKTLAQSDAQQKALQSMQYDQTAAVEQLDDKNQPARREVLQMIVRPGAHPSTQIISAKGDNVPTNPDQARAQSRDVENNKQTFTLRQLVDRFDIALAGEDQIFGQATYVISFTPKPNQPYRDETEKVVDQLQGRMWISKQTYNVLQTQATLAHPVTIAWFLASIPILDFQYTTHDSPAGFAPCQVRITLQVKAPFVGFHQRQTIDMANFRSRPVVPDHPS